jgi:hypothetical protein
METRRFDQLTAALGTDASRRRVLGSLGAAVGLLLGGDLATEAANRHKGGKKRPAKKGKAKRGGGALELEAKPECDPTNDQCQANLLASDPDTCLTAACTKPVRENRYRCVYTRNNSLCTDPAAPICCNYRLGSATSGACVAHGEICSA